VIACPICASPHTRGPLAPTGAPRPLSVGIDGFYAKLGWIEAHVCAADHAFTVPACAGYCAHCTRERRDLELHPLDGRLYWICRDCREAPVRGSSYHWDGPETSSRSSRTDGNRWKGRHGG